MTAPFSCRAMSSTAVLQRGGGHSPPQWQRKVLSTTSSANDPFLRDGTATSRLFRAYRTQLPFPLRMLGIGLLGFTLGLVIEIFACKTHLYESVMMKKDARRHEFDEFVVDFREKVERWQQEDMSHAAAATIASGKSGVRG